MNRRRSAAAALSALALACLTTLTATAAAAQQGVDVVFLVDTSRIVAEWDTADASRLAVAHGVVDAMRDLGPQRVGVLSLSGNAAAPPGGWATLKLTPLPDDPAEVSAFLEQTVHPALSSLGSDGACLPLNVALQKHLAAMLETRGEPSRPLWLVLLSHGKVDPLGPNGEEDWLTEAVRQRTEELTGHPFKRAERPDIRNAAGLLLLENLPTLLQDLGENVSLSIVDVNAPGDEAISVPLDGQPVGLLASLTAQPLVTLHGSDVREVVQALMAQSPFAGRAAAPGIVVRDLTGALTQRFRIYQGTRWARLSLLGDHGDYQAELAWVEGTPTDVGYTLSGAGRLAQSLDMSQPTPGLVELRVTPGTAAAPLNLQARLRFELDLDLVVQAPVDGAVLPLGSSLELVVRLVDKLTDDDVSDDQLLTDSSFATTWTLPDGREQREDWSPSRGVSHSSRVTPEALTDGPQGFGWAVEASLLPRDAGGFDWTVVRSGVVRAEFGTPGLTMTFIDADKAVAHATGATGGSLTFAPEWISGSVTLGAMLRIEVDLLGAGGQAPVVLHFEPSPDYSAAAAKGSISASMTLDGTPVIDGTPIPFGDGVPRTLAVSVSKSGIPPFSGSIGTLVAELGSADEPAGARVDLSMAPAIGATTVLSLLGLLVALLLLFLLIRKLLNNAAYKSLVANLADGDVLYFHDDEPGAPVPGSSG